MLVHRILDVVFRTLDTVDAVRARVGAVLGSDSDREPQPSSLWPPGVEAPPPAISVDVGTVNTYTDTASIADAWRARPDAEGSEKKPEPAKKAKAKKPAKSEAAKPKSDAKAAKPKSEAAKPKKKAAAKEPTKGRKGSVDRKGEDFDSPRARAVEAWLKDQKASVVTADAALDNKKTLARVLWAVGAADAAGSEHGLTAADASALLSMSAGLDVFSTNVARAFRDESDLFAETIPDGRSKRYKLTAAGRARLGEVETA